MSGRLTLWGAGQILNSYFSRTTAPPENFYLALIAQIPPNGFVSGAEIDEPDQASYSRIAVPNDGVNWTDNGQVHVISTEVDVTFTQAQEDWGILRYWALCQTDVDGMVYAVGNLEDPLDVNTGDTVVLGAGDLSITLGPFFSPEEG